MIPSWANDLSYFLGGSAWMAVAMVIAENVRAARRRRKAREKDRVELVNGRRMFHASNGDLVDLDKLSDSLR